MSRSRKMLSRYSAASQELVPEYDPKTHIKMPNIVGLHVCNPRDGEADTEKSQGLAGRPV